VFRRRARPGAIALGLVLLAQVGLVGRVSAQASEPEQVLEQFERALNAHDEEAVVRLFAADGTLRDNHNPGEVITPTQMRGWVRKAGEVNLHAHLDGYTPSNGKTQFTIEVGEGEWYRNGGTPLRARGTAEVRGGRIVALVLDPVAQAPAGARVVSRESLSGVPLVVIALALGGLVALGAGFARVRLQQRQPAPIARPVGGTLHSALGAWSAARRRPGLTH
jgi:hypothetical protein